MLPGAEREPFRSEAACAALSYGVREEGGKMEGRGVGRGRWMVPNGTRSSVPYLS